MPAYFPLFVNLSGKTVSVFGAGQIAARRVSALLRYGACVTVTAPEIGTKIRELSLELSAKTPRQLLLKEHAYRPGEIEQEHADYVLAATDDHQVNAAITAECKNKGIPVNNASDSSQCDFYFPALVEREQLVIGVTSTDGNHKKTARFCEKLRRLDDLASQEEGTSHLHQ